ncbi:MULTISPECIES: response regulator [unclassified Knoellia]|uniref:response regulator n=1 Tax=Knoellia altitudinis TaxID=3404795 RepID=UPI00361FD0C8
MNRPTSDQRGSIAVTMQSSTREAAPRRIPAMGGRVVAPERAWLAAAPPGSASAPERIRLVIADDHDLYRQGLKVVFDLEPDFEIVAEAGSAGEAVSRCSRLRPDVVILGHQMPGTAGIEACAAIARASPNTNIVVLTSSDEDGHLYAALQAGATGYLLKDTPAKQVVESVRLAYGGQSVIPASMAGRFHAELASLRASVRTESPLGQLSEREREVLRLVARGRTNKDIAARLLISENTVKSHMRTLLNKLPVSSRVEAALFAVQQGLVEERD